MIEFLDSPLNEVQKKWGLEQWFHNDILCLKILHVKRGNRCSMHYHAIKEEIFVIIEGEMFLEWIDTKTGEKHGYLCGKDCKVRVPPNTPHRFVGVNSGCTFLEFSTHHDDNDSYRVEAGDNQEK